MTNEEINRLIHVEIMGECWHEFRRKHTKQIEYECLLCGSDNSGVTNPDYCNDLNAVAKAEAKVIAEVGPKLYGEILLDVLEMESLYYNPNIGNGEAAIIATATASVRCAIENEGEMNTKPVIGRFSTPVEDYCKAIKKIKTIEDVRSIEAKYAPILDDAAECFAHITNNNFHEFLSEFPLCFKEGGLPSEDWLDQFGAIPLPELFIHLAPLLQTQMGSGFVMHRLLDEKMAEIKDGRFVFRPARAI